MYLTTELNETSTSTGTGTINLSATAETGFETFVAGIGDTNNTFYCISHDGTSEFEVGIGTVTDAALIHFLEILLSPLQIQITKWIFQQELKLYFVLILQNVHRLQV